MSSAENIDDELKGVSPGLCSITKESPFAVPEGYFEDNVHNTLQLIRHIDNDQSTPYEENLFIAPVLQLCDKTELLKVPVGYFDRLPEEILSKVKSVKGYVVNINSRRRHIWQYSRAAIVTGVIAISGLMVYNNQNPYDTGGSEVYSSEQQVNEGISKLSNDEIIKYLDGASSPSEETISNNLDEQELPNSDELTNLTSGSKVQK